jgi:nucleolin
MMMSVSSSCLAAGAVRSESVVAKNGARVSLGASQLCSKSLAMSVSGSSTLRSVAVVARVSELGQSVAVEESREGEFSDNRAAPTPGAKLYVGNVPWTCDSQELAEVFQDAGNVELVEVIYDRDNGRSRGFAFVTMASEEEARVAIEKLDGLELGGRALRVNFPQSNKEPRLNNYNDRPPRREGGRDGAREGGYGNRRESGSSSSSENKLFVGNLSWNVDNVGLEQLFSDYGKVVDAKVVYDRESGKSRGFGFVTFSDAQEVTGAISNLDGADFDGRQLRVNMAGEKPERTERRY